MHPPASREFLLEEVSAPGFTPSTEITRTGVPILTVVENGILSVRVGRKEIREWVTRDFREQP